MDVNLHNPDKAYFERFSGSYGPFVLLRLSKGTDYLNLFLTAEQEGMARAIADIFNGDIDALVSRIEDVMIDVNGRDHGTRGIALAIACDLIGKDLSEALRERREAEDAA